MAVFKIKLAFASTVLLGMELLQVLLPHFSMLMTFCRMSKAKGRLHQTLGNSVDSRTELLNIAASLLALSLTQSFLKETAPCF